MDRLKGLTLRQKAELTTGRDFWNTHAHAEQGIRSIAFSDGPHGLRRQVSKGDSLKLTKSLPATCFPTASVMACSWDTELCQSVGEALGREAASLGVDVLLGPAMNVKRDPLCGRNYEYFSEDPYLSGSIATAYVKGIQGQGVNACVKHFAANNREFCRMTSNSVVEERALREIYLTGFEMAVRHGGARVVMSSYNKVNGEFANENAHLLSEILRGEWGFNGVVVTDWLGSNDRVKGLKCGNQLEMPACRYGVDEIVEAVQNGELDEGILDESILKLLALAQFSDGKTTAPVDLNAHHTLAVKCAEQSMVLLSNDGVLPLNKSSKIAVIGDFAFNPRYQGGGSSIVNATRKACVKDVLSSNGNVVFARGFDRYGREDKALMKQAIEVAAEADAVVFFAGLDERIEAEGMERPNMNINENQKELFAALRLCCRQLAVVLCCGSSVETEWCNTANAVLWAGLSGQGGAEATVNLLFGDAVPCGKLAESWARRYEDCPVSYLPAKIQQVEYREGIFVGYRYYSTTGVDVAFPFGHGLSYTHFEYSDISVCENGVSFSVCNTGDMDGAEIAQVYVKKMGSSLPRPDRELKGFAKIFLQKGEKKAVFIPFDEYTFRVFDAQRGSFVEENGGYQILVGSSSNEVKLSCIIERQGAEIAPVQYPHYTYGRVNEITDDEWQEIYGRPIVAMPTAKKGISVCDNTIACDMKYAKSFIARVFYCIIQVAAFFCRVFAKKENSGTLVNGMLYLPMRGIAKYAGFSSRQKRGLMLALNGKLLKGLKLMLRK